MIRIPLAAAFQRQSTSKSGTSVAPALYAIKSKAQTLPMRSVLFATKWEAPGKQRQP
jgi:hypothetical protein